jgi:hypothetical protein
LIWDVHSYVVVYSDLDRVFQRGDAREVVRFSRIYRGSQWKITNEGSVQQHWQQSVSAMARLVIDNGPDYKAPCRLGTDG